MARWSIGRKTTRDTQTIKGLIMKSHWKRWLFPAIAAVLLSTPVLADDEKKVKTAPKKSDKVFLWKATSATNTVYLMGSIHAGKADLYPMDKTIMDAYKASKTIAFELDITKVDQGKMMGLVQKYCIYGDGTTLADHISKETLATLKAHLAKNQIPYASLAPFKPGMVANQLSLIAISKIGYSTESGIDKHFLDLAHKEKKNVVALEKIEDQLPLLAFGTDKEQETNLAKGLEGMGDLKKFKAEFDNLFKAWKNGDAGWVLKWGTKDMKKDEKGKDAFWEAMVVNRNKKMAEKVDAMLKGKEPALVIVGSLHIVGEQGLVKLLQAKKYKVEQMSKAKVPVGAGKGE
jgi:uncharacterized protein